MVHEDWTRYGFWVLHCEDGIIAQSSDWGRLPAEAAAAADKGDPLRIAFHYLPTAATFGPVTIPAGATPHYFRRVERAGGRLVRIEFHIGYRDGGGQQHTMGIDAETGRVIQTLS